MKKYPAGLLSIVLIGLSCLQGCAQGPSVVDKTDNAQASRQADTKAAVAGLKPGLKFETEEQWLVDTVGRDVAEMITYANAKAKSTQSEIVKLAAADIIFKIRTVDKAAATYEYTVSEPAQKIDEKFQLTLTDYIWSPNNYEPFAKKLIADLRLSPQAVSQPPADFLTELANNDMVGLIAVNERLSKDLSARPLDAALHEQAAMLEAKFNMEEIAGNFTEDRPQLSRGCAHLAIARALNNDKLGPVGQLAEVALELMSVRDGMVQERLDALEKQASDATTRSWVRALRMRATSDCRAYKEADHTGVEESQYILRSSNDGYVTRLLQTFLDSHKPVPIALLRILANNNHSVEVGHLLATQIVPMELASFKNDYVAYKKNEPVDQPDKALAELNLTPKRCLAFGADGTPSLNVISWDDIAAFHCRHLLSATVIEYNFNQHKFGVPERAKATIEKIKNLCANVDMRPLALSECELERSDREEALKADLAFLQNSPQLITSDIWQVIKRSAKEFKSKQASSSVADQIPLMEKWFDPAMPMGTDYDFYSRHELANCKRDLAALTQMRKYCPYMYDLNAHWAHAKYGDSPNADQYSEAFGKMVEYNTLAMSAVATGALKEPDKFIAIEEKIAALQPSYYLVLGDYCVLHNRPEQAAKYFEIAVVKSEDAVQLSNDAGWLINYRYDHGQKEKAKELADFCGEVYSCQGLESLAHYYERAGDLAGAERTYRNIIERYDNYHAWIAFLVRNSAKDKKYEEEAQKLVKLRFPDGMKKITLAQLQGSPAPTRGVLVLDGDFWVSDSPIIKNTVIVAMNGYSVDNINQFNVARNMSMGDTLTAIIWDGKKYLETKKVVISAYKLRIKVENFTGVYAKDESPI